MIEPIFNKYKTKFTVLDKLQPINPKADRVVVYINLETVLESLCKPFVNKFAMTQMSSDEVRLCLVSNIINLAQHYRLYFRKMGKENETILFWNFPIKETQYYNSKYIVNYRNNYYDKFYKEDNASFMADLLQNVYDILMILLPYINEVYMVSSDKIESSLLPYIVYKNKYDSHHIQNIIVSKDIYDLQYIQYGMSVLVPRSDDSLLITETNVMEHLKKVHNIKSKLNAPVSQLSFIISLLGSKYRNIGKIPGMGLGLILQTLNDALDSISITENTQNIDNLVNIIKPEYGSIFHANYHCTDLGYQYRDIKPIDIHTVLESFTDKYDDNAVLYMNERYFEKYPLMLVSMKREQVLSNDNRKGTAIH